MWILRVYYFRVLWASTQTSVCVWCAASASATSVIDDVVKAAEAYHVADLTINKAIGDHGAAAILQATGKR